MNAAKSLSASPLGVPAGPWRWAALGFVLLALAAAGLTIALGLFPSLVLAWF
jgi:hypothetical protein